MASFAELQKRAQLMLHEGRLRSTTGEAGKERAIVDQLKKELKDILVSDAQREKNRQAMQQASKNVGDSTQVQAHDRKGSEGVKGHDRKMKPGERGQAIAKEMLRKNNGN